MLPNKLLETKIMYTDHEFKEFIYTALNATKQTEIDVAFLKIYGKYPNLRFAITLDSLPEQRFSNIDVKFLNGKNAVIPLFENSKLYFMSDNIFNSMYYEGEYKFQLDSSVMLDTNCATYIKSFIFRDNIPNYREVINIIHQLINNKINFDYIFYLIENYKQVFHLIDQGLSKEDFWNDLNPNMRDNLIALQLFIKIDRDIYRKTYNPTPSISFAEAEDLAKDFAYELYFSPSFVLTEPIRKMALISQILLYKTIFLKFSSKKNAKSKANNFIQFMVEEVGAYADTELFIAIDYFNNSDHLKIFNKINKGCGINKNVFQSRIENISWDLMIPRYMQYMSYSFGHGDFFIPFFLTFDDHLSKILDVYKAKIFVYDDDSHSLTVIPVGDNTQKLEQYIDKDTMKYFSPELVKKRRGRSVKIETLYNLLSDVRTECTDFMC